MRICGILEYKKINNIFQKHFLILAIPSEKTILSVFKHLMKNFRHLEISELKFISINLFTYYGKCNFITILYDSFLAVF